MIGRKTLHVAVADTAVGRRARMTFTAGTSLQGVEPVRRLRQGRLPSQTALPKQVAGPLQRRQQGAPVSLLAVHPRLFGLLFGAARLLAAQAEIAIEAKLQRAGLILEQRVDDRALARAGRLEEGDLGCGLERRLDVTAPGGRSRIAVDPVLRLSSLIMVRDAVRAGVGAGCLPVSLVSHDLGAGTLVHWGDIDGPDTVLWALYPSRRLLSAGVSAFLDHLKQSFPTGVPDELASFIGA